VLRQFGAGVLAFGDVAQEREQPAAADHPVRGADFDIPAACRRAGGARVSNWSLPVSMTGATVTSHCCGVDVELEVVDAHRQEFAHGVAGLRAIALVDVGQPAAHESAQKKPSRVVLTMLRKASCPSRKAVSASFALGHVFLLSRSR
jgi:hypothetical protein